MLLKAKTFINKHSSGLLAVISCKSSSFEINLFLENKMVLDRITLMLSANDPGLHKGNGFIISQNKGLRCLESILNRLNRKVVPDLGNPITKTGVDMLALGRLLDF